MLSHRGLYHDLPQTLGLEVIPYESYVYTTRGVVRTPEERAQAAQQLAGEPRWLAMGGPRYWVEPFAERAGAILVMPYPVAVASAALDVATNAAFHQAARDIRGLFRKRRGDGAPGMIAESIAPMQEDYYGDGPMTDSQLFTYHVRMRNYFVGAFPSKTFQLSRDDIKRLRRVRAFPRD